ncbi:MAG: hypothetical protein NVSMB18_19570 [Acetobacteraceae bacterium]
MAKKKSKAPYRSTGIVLVKQPGEDWKQVMVEVQRKRGITWQTLQGLVGGFYEGFTAGNGTIVVNEDGHALKMQPCVGVKRMHGPPLVLVGPVVVVANQFDREGKGT